VQEEQPHGTNNVCYTEVFFTLSLTYTTVATQNMYTYHYYNTKHVHVPMGTANINAYFQGTGILGCFAVESSHFVVAASLF
jgi:hypothetical protein